MREKKRCIFWRLGVRQLADVVLGSWWLIFFGKRKDLPDAGGKEVKDWQKRFV